MWTPSPRAASAFAWISLIAILFSGTALLLSERWQVVRERVYESEGGTKSVGLIRGQLELVRSKGGLQFILSGGNVDSRFLSTPVIVWHLLDVHAGRYPRRLLWPELDRKAGVCDEFSQQTTIPLWPVWVLLATPTLLWWVHRLKMSRWRHRGLCLHCGYDLSNLPTGVCPECGHPSPAGREPCNLPPCASSTSQPA
jgi:hypothetical protein